MPTSKFNRATVSAHNAKVLAKLRATSTTTATKAATKTAPVMAEANPVTAPTATTNPVDEAMLRHAETIADSLQDIKLPSKTRLFITAIAGVISYAATLYWGVVAAEWFAAAALAFTGSGFIAFVLIFLGYLFAIVAALRVGYSVAKFVIGFNASELTQTVAAAKAAMNRPTSTIKGWFAPAAA